MSEDVQIAAEPTDEDLAGLGPLARIAWQAWAEDAPTALSLMPDPRAHFSMLEREAEMEEDRIVPQLQGPDQPGESTIEKAGRIRAAQSRAREMVIAEMLRPPHQLQDPEDEDLDRRDVEAFTTGISYYLLPWVTEEPDRQEMPDLWEEYQDRLVEKLDAQDQERTRQERRQQERQALIARAREYLGLND